jgi:RND superfamily putative drug exporter
VDSLDSVDDLGIDYSLFVISRFREERARGLDKEAAIRRMGATASRAVLFSGSTFVVALLGLFIVRPVRSRSSQRSRCFRRSSA